jgi:hypothetical protein
MTYATPLLKSSNTLYIDPVYGNDSTGMRNMVTNPYLTFSGAHNAASA